LLVVGTKFALLVEDNPDEVILAERAFRKAQVPCELAVASDGQEALDFLFRGGKHADRAEKGNPFLVLLDLNLPLIGGLEVLRKIRSDESTCLIPVVVFTSSTVESDEAACYELGANDYIRKPTGFSEFVEIIQRLKSLWFESTPGDS
jgi:two-component system, response regulator